MLAMNELLEFHMQQQMAHEIYRQQIMQRIPDPFPPFFGQFPLPHHLMAPPPPLPPAHPTLPGVEVKLENADLWQQFHQIGTEMIITKTGRRMFPSMRISLSGLEEEANYCVLLEMVPIGDCRYKFSGSQWVPAGGAEPQSPQRMYLHPDSPATGAHFQAQPLLFNKVKLTNNTLDNNGHVVLASMHKYQPRIHVIRTSDLAQIPWAPQQAFVFPETEFVAVTAYQNDRITKLKIDNNPFAKGFRESGQARCKRKMSSSPTFDGQTNRINGNGNNNIISDDFPRSSNSGSDDDRASIGSSHSHHHRSHRHRQKRLRRSDDHGQSGFDVDADADDDDVDADVDADADADVMDHKFMATAETSPMSTLYDFARFYSTYHHQQNQQNNRHHCLSYAPPMAYEMAQHIPNEHIDYARHAAQTMPSPNLALCSASEVAADGNEEHPTTTDGVIDVVSTDTTATARIAHHRHRSRVEEEASPPSASSKTSSFSISSILGGRKIVAI